MINIDLDSDRSRNSVLTKSITLGELTDSIINKDYSPNPFLPLRQPFMQHRPELTDMWKMNRRSTPHQPPPRSATSESRNITTESRHAVPSAISSRSDSRNPSSSDTRHYHESVTPPENYHYVGVQSMNSRITQQPQRFALDCYVKNRIAEAMRTTDDGKRPEEYHDSQRRTPQRTPPDMIIEEEASTTNTSSSSNVPSSAQHILSKSYTYPSHLAEINSVGQSPQPPPATTFSTTTYAYPFSALNVSGATATLSPSIKTAIAIDTERCNMPPLQEPKPLLSAQYEALSDED